VAQGSKSKQAYKAKMLHKSAGGSGDFGDAEQHTPKPCCIPVI